MSFFAELKRRNVIRMAGLYLLGAWLIIQIAETLLPIFRTPDWVLQTLVVLLAIGFLPALIFSWLFELTPDGIKRDAEVDAAQSMTTSTGRRMDRLLLVGMLAVIGVVAADRWWPHETADPADATRSTAVASSALADGSDDAASDTATDPLTEPVAQGIAVLPFANLSADPEQAFFADGITEDILTRLAGIDGLRVISRTSVMRYKGTTLGLPDIAAELGVTHVLEGSVRRAGDRVRITGQLIRAADDDHLWAETFDRDLEDIFTVQSEIAGRIAEALEITLTDRDTRRIAQRGTRNVRAYELYLRGRAVFNRSYSNPAEVSAMSEEALRWFRDALVEDPDYAAAEAGKSSALLWGLQFKPVDRRPAVLTEAIEAARRAIQLAPELADGYIQLGQAQQVAGDEQAALTQFLKAADITPDDPDTLGALASLHARQGRLLDAIHLARLAQIVEPNNANRLDWLSFLYQSIGLLDQAIAGIERAWSEITPHPARRECVAGYAALLAGQAERARASAEQALDFEPDSPFVAMCVIGTFDGLRDAASSMKLLDQHAEFVEAIIRPDLLWALSQSGDQVRLEHLRAVAERRLTELPRASGTTLAYSLGQIAMLRGQTEPALDHLERAVQQGWRQYRVLAVDPIWDPVRDSPRFVALEKQVDADLARMREELAKQDAAP